MAKTELKTLTIPQIKKLADEEIWKTVVALLERGVEQKGIAELLDVSPSWMSRYLNKNADKIKSNPEISNWAYRCGYSY